MRCDDSDQLCRPRRLGRRGVVAMFVVVAGLVVVCATATTRSGSVSTSHAFASGSMAIATAAAGADATVAQTATHVGRFVTAHRPTVAANALSLLLLLPLLLTASRRPSIPVAVTPRRFRGGTPLLRGPPTFLAR